MPLTLTESDLAQTLERAYALAIGRRALPAVWLSRAEGLSESPSVAFIAAVGSVLLAKATNPSIDAFVIQAHEGSAGAFNLRAAATALGRKRRELGYDIGSSSVRDPINHGTLIGSTRWDLALSRIREDHKPFFSLILTWLPEINTMSQQEALEAFAAYLRVRRQVARGAAVTQVPPTLFQAPELTDLIEVLDGFVGADPEGGARGMALVAAEYRSAGFEVGLPSRNDPRRIDVPIRRAGVLQIASEVKQVDTTEATADQLARDAAANGASRALLAVLRPGSLVGFDRTGTIRRAEADHGIVLRVVASTRELTHEALMSASDVALVDFRATLPRAFAEALRDIRAADSSIETWAAISSRWH
jgi:hypothetical protein